MIDARLVGPALAAWAGALVSLVGLTSIDALDSRRAGALYVMALGVLAALVAVAGLLVVRRGATVVITVAAGALGVLASAGQIAGWTSPALVAAMSTQAEVRGTIGGPVRTSMDTAFVPLAVDQVTTRHATVHAQVPVTLTVPRFTDIPAAGTPVSVIGRLRPAGNSVTSAAYLNAEEVLARGPASRMHRAAQSIRESLARSLPDAPPGGSALVAGLAIGDEQHMSPELVEQMRNSGLAHLTAVSGGNVAMVVGAVLGIAWMIRLPMVVRVLCALAALGFYVVVVHPQPSVLRAAVMGSVVVVSLVVGGRRSGPSILAAAVLILVVLAPSLSARWGFALSVAATAGIVLLAPALQRAVTESRWGHRVPVPVTMAATITIAAQIATAPVLLAMGAFVGLAAIPANLVSMPVVPLITLAGLGAAVLAVVPVGEAPADFLAWIGAWAGEWIARVAAVASQVEVLRIRGSAPLAILALGGAVAIGVAHLRRHRRDQGGVRPSAVAVAGVISTAVIVWSAFPPSARSWPPRGWLMTQCDVGQGDALVVAPRDGAGAVVIDVGPSARAIDSCLSDLGVHHVSAVVLTHFHADHVGGLTGLIDGRRVDAVFATVYDEPVEQFRGVGHELRRRGMSMRRLLAGSTIDVGSSTYRVLWPRRIITGGRISNGSIANNASLVLEANLDGVRVLLTGDIEPPAQAALVSGPGGFDVVKIPHHGSAHQHPLFAPWAQADLAVVSAGSGNRFGHPSPDTLQAWIDTGARVVRTDQSGDVAIVRRGDGSLGFATRRDMLGSS
ncbi:MAG: ComEC/Rec2 family competence protein [Actinomycetia bacterium]|nr:ComEC/Rec2 family competence protein [Actinomycetes bacterium]MCH9788632.1 ComEC/Rec2 family competence protein [Actinomycetes bacterium]MCH9850370.1 ComEC/Rec2 family competence protein [Actinomycetes bacterium]NKB94191.1 MBL fold metallo-hydrolase [Candidatus Nanopelagicales bacterium]